MKDSQQLGLADYLLNSRRKQSCKLSKLSPIDDLVDWKQDVSQIGVDFKSKLITKATFIPTPANVHGSTQAGYLVSYNEASLIGEKAYGNARHKYSARCYGWCCGVLRSSDRGQTLSPKTAVNPGGFITVVDTHYYC